ncbi:RimJ/RimL family protein N-acetyltransferase [Hymenobacter luteus]|uniref:RimJ/RimL family protein N-acetyltransferase n=2 Tax=Hymenobacter TaxID=89966 RepID=A0A7W9WAQ9_9BACT|nr:MULTISPECIES: GNAT family N-acetyltransferase [Hymenobacter]MBB4600100.1 RimJ/RimL family protein N-acetyltransferase [Hymenobacter latericoloratus]MBB6057590.1 RimJ/RimL family protein N-acetyltransferase [Hymenobacter luteus]
MYDAAPPLPSPSGAPILSARLTLRPYLPSDAADFFQLIDLNRLRLQPSFPAREGAVRVPADAVQVLAQFRQDWVSGRLYVLGIWDTATGRYLGDISLKPNWSAPVTLEIGYYLAETAEGQGYAREALGAVVGFGFNTLNASRLLIRCRANNPRSCAVAEATGFQHLPPRPRPWPLRPFLSAEQAVLYYIRRRE